eukprot:3749549-Pleurochrysis_carterae.AAC.1
MLPRIRSLPQRLTKQELLRECASADGDSSALFLVLNHGADRGHDRSNSDRLGLNSAYCPADTPCVRARRPRSLPISMGLNFPFPLCPMLFSYGLCFSSMAYAFLLWPMLFSYGLCFSPMAYAFLVWPMLSPMTHAFVKASQNLTFLACSYLVLQVLRACRMHTPFSRACWWLFRRTRPSPSTLSTSARLDSGWRRSACVRRFKRWPSRKARLNSRTASPRRR